MPPVDPPPRVLLLTGEASGDRYGALLAREIRARLPEALFHGIGGEAMSGAGVRILFESHHIAVTGVVEVFGSLRPIRAA